MLALLVKKYFIKIHPFEFYKHSLREKKFFVKNEAMVYYDKNGNGKMKGKFNDN